MVSFVQFRNSTEEKIIKKKKKKKSQTIIKFLCITQTKITQGGDKHLLVSSAGSIREALVIYLSIPNWLAMDLQLGRRQ